MGAKLKFDEADMSYKMPKYIVDSGARSLSTRGVSVYIVNGNLIFELATAKKAWKVCQLYAEDKFATITLDAKCMRSFIDNLNVLKSHKTLGPPTTPLKSKLT